MPRNFHSGLIGNLGLSAKANLADWFLPIIHSLKICALRTVKTVWRGPSFFAKNDLTRSSLAAAETRGRGPAPAPGSSRPRSQRRTWSWPRRRKTGPRGRTGGGRSCTRTAGSRRWRRASWQRDWKKKSCLWPALLSQVTEISRCIKSQL